MDELIAQLRTAQAKLLNEDTNPPSNAVPPALILQPLSSKITTLATHSQTAEKELLSQLSKFNKSLEKKFNKPVPSQANALGDNKDVLHRVISEHLVREGKFGAARVFESEGGGKVVGGEEFAEMYEVLASLKGTTAEVDPELMDTDDVDHSATHVHKQPGQPDLLPALNWARKNAEALWSVSSHLEFELLKARFVQMRGAGVAKKELVEFVRKEMSGWAERGFEKGVFRPEHQGMLRKLTILSTSFDF